MGNGKDRLVTCAVCGHPKVRGKDCRTCELFVESDANK